MLKYTFSKNIWIYFFLNFLNRSYGRFVLVSFFNLFIFQLLFQIIINTTLVNNIYCVVNSECISTKKNIFFYCISRAGFFSFFFYFDRMDIIFVRFFYEKYKSIKMILIKQIKNTANLQCFTMIYVFIV